MSLTPAVTLYPIHGPESRPTPYPSHVDANTVPEQPVQFYVTFADSKAYSLPIKPGLDGGKVYSKSPPPIESLAAPDLLSMTEVWEKEFRVIFAAFLPHRWFLIKTDRSPSPRWRKFKDSAKVRFCCQTCGHAWTSMKGRVMFWFFLNPDPNYPEGFLHYKLYGQQCNKCQNGYFEDAMWYPEEVNKVLGNVYNKIGQSYYGFVQLPIRQERRAGRPRTQHNSALCQACIDGECYRAPKPAEDKTITQPVTPHAPTVTIPAPPSQRLILPVHQTIVHHKSTSISPLVY